MGLIKATGEFFRELLDTHGRIATVGALIILLGGSALVTAISQAIFGIHGLFLLAIGLLVFGLLVLLGALYVAKHPLVLTGQLVTPAAEATQQLALQPGVAAQLPDFNFARYFRVAHVSQLTEQTERDIKLLVAQQHPNDREEALAKFIGIGYWGCMHEATWANIFRSQLMALTELNRRSGIMPLSDMRAFYDTAVASYPETYINYPFESWFGFMRNFDLVIRHPSEMIEITLRGRDFLTFIAHWGWNIEGKRF